MDLKQIWAALTVGGALVGPHFPTYAGNSASIELGSYSQTEMARVGIQWKWEVEWLKTSETHVGGYWDLSLAQWHLKRYQNNPSVTDRITVLGITPVFRLQNNTLSGLYAEIGIGANYLSHLYDNDGKKLSTRFQFGDHLGVGYVFENNLDVSLKIQHFSNGGIKRPNSGVNFAIIRVSYPF